MSLPFRLKGSDSVLSFLFFFLFLPRHSQTVVTDGDIQTPSTAYLSTPTSEKSLAYYSNEKEEEAADEPQRNRPIRATHFADELGQT